MASAAHVRVAHQERADVPGSALRELRRAAGLTPLAVAIAAGRGPASVAQAETQPLIRRSTFALYGSAIVELAEARAQRARLLLSDPEIHVALDARALADP